MIGFDRRYVFVSVLIGIALVATGFFAIETGSAKLVADVTNVQRSQDRDRMLVEFLALMTDAEAGQRGFVLTNDTSYLEPYEQAKKKINGYSTAINAAYANNAFDDMQPLATQLIQLAAAKISELDATSALYNEGTPKQGSSRAVALVKTNIGLNTMDALRDVVTTMRTKEHGFVAAQTVQWHRTQNINRAISAADAVLSIALILLAGYLVSNYMRRRAQVVTGLEAKLESNAQNLSELSTHLQQLAELEKHSLARELHDELGGLLVGIKMDLSQLRSKIDFTAPDVQKRWDRIQGLLSTGIDLKRRIIEELRPSLLDNMGLIAAIQWQAGEISAAAGLQLKQHYPEQEPDITGEAAIALFRIAQEALTNIVKHAQATQAWIEMVVSDTQLLLLIEDNGIGLPVERWSAIGSHGITGMRHRLLSFDGAFAIEKVEPSGTRLRVTLPMSRISTFSTHAP